MWLVQYLKLTVGVEFHRQCCFELILEGNLPDNHIECEIEKVFIDGNLLVASLTRKDVDILEVPEACGAERPAILMTDWVLESSVGMG